MALLDSVDYVRLAAASRAANSGERIDAAWGRFRGDSERVLIAIDVPGLIGGAHRRLGGEHDFARRGGGTGGQLQGGGHRVVGDLSANPWRTAASASNRMPNSSAARAACAPTARCSIHVAPPPG